MKLTIKAYVPDAPGDDLTERLAWLRSILAEKEAGLAAKGDRPAAADVLAAAHDELLAILRFADCLGGIDIMELRALRQLVDAVMEVREGRPSALLVPAHVARKLRLGDNAAAKDVLRRKAIAAALMQLLIDDGYQRMHASRLVAEKLVAWGFKAKVAGVDRWWDDARKGRGAKKYQYYLEQIGWRRNTLDSLEILENWGEKILKGTADAI